MNADQHRWRHGDAAPTWLARALGIWLLAVGCAQAGLSPLRTLVVVNTDSQNSLEVGRYYAEQRGIPDRNILRLEITNRINIALDAYSNLIEGPVHAYINQAGLSGQVDAVVFSMDIPHRVFRFPGGDNRWAGLTACMYYGFYSSPNAFVFGCDLAAGSDHDYFQAERSFSRSGAPSSNRYLISGLLTATNLANARSLVRRSAAADGTTPAGRIYLVHTGDGDRSVQWEEYDEVEYLGRFIDTPQTQVRLDGITVSGQTNLFGVTAGRRNHAWLPSNTVLPGAYAEHLTSYGGYLFESRPDSGQMSVLEWIRYGFSGTYGTVVEPCAYTNKFPSPRIHYWYARGFSLGESLYMAVQNPYQGNFIGDPLCAPYAMPPDLTWEGLTNGVVLAGDMMLTGAVWAASSDRPVDQVSWWLDGLFQETVTNIAPAPGNIVTININGSSRSHTVKPGNTIYSVATGLTAQLNRNPPLGITARAVGDRITIARNSLGVDSSAWSCGAGASAGTAGVTTVQIWNPAGDFINTAQAAREGLTLSNFAGSGDVVRVTITRIDGQAFTNTYTETTASRHPESILDALAGMINADTNLQAATGCRAKYSRSYTNGATTTAELWLFARTNSWEGHNLLVDYEVEDHSGSGLTGPDFTDNFNDNAGVLGARATVFISAGSTQLFPVVSIATTNLPDGPHTLSLVAREGTGVGTEGRADLRVIIDNHDLDCTILAPSGGVHRLKTGVLTVEVDTAVSAGSVTQVMLYAEGKAAATGTVSSLDAELALDAFGAGTLNLQAQAWADGGRSTVSPVVSLVLFTDVDADGISDQWELDAFGGFTNFNGEADADGDGYRNYEEFMADTEPTNAASYFELEEIEPGRVFRFPVRDTRWYQVQVTDAELPEAAWLPVGPVIGGTNGVATWTDDGTGDVRSFAVEPRLPQ